jgi:hypothetical protein
MTAKTATRIPRRKSSPTATDAERPRPAARYMASEGISPFLHSWRPALREPAADVMSSYQLAAARAIETIQNSGWISGGIEQAIASTIGTGLRLAAKPDEKALGWSPDMASEWARQVESRWENYANRPTECDVRGESTLGKLTAQALRSYFAYGEITAALPFRRRPTSFKAFEIEIDATDSLAHPDDVVVVLGLPQRAARLSHRLQDHRKHSLRSAAPGPPSPGRRPACAPTP